MPGLFFAGDAVATTTPNFGRGLATSLMQVRELLRLLDAHGPDLGEAGEEFDAVCEGKDAALVEDHFHMDPPTPALAGEDDELGERLPSDLTTAALPADPTHGLQAMAPYSP